MLRFLWARFCCPYEIYWPSFLVWSPISCDICTSFVKSKKIEKKGSDNCEVTEVHLFHQRMKVTTIQRKKEEKKERVAPLVKATCI